jgi:hypothetical protein
MKISFSRVNERAITRPPDGTTVNIWPANEGVCTSRYPMVETVITVQEMLSFTSVRE